MIRIRRKAPDSIAANVCRLGIVEGWNVVRSEEHTSELQSLRHLVCRLLLEKKKKNNISKQLDVEEIIHEIITPSQKPNENITNNPIKALTRKLRCEHDYVHLQTTKQRAGSS